MRDVEYARLGVALGATTLAAGHDGVMVSQNLADTLREFSRELQRQQGKQIYRVMVSELHTSSSNPEKVVELILLVGRSCKEVAEWCDATLRDEAGDEVAAVRFRAVFEIRGDDMRSSLNLSSPDESITDVWDQVSTSRVNGLVSIQRRSKRAGEDEEILEEERNVH